MSHADDDTPPPHRRRPRYRGTHPRRFDERYKELAPQAHPGMHDHIRAQGRTPAGTHVAVLLDEVVAVLRPQAGDVVADCTLGYGGHAAALLEHIGPTGRLVGLDIDAAQLARTAERLGVVSVGPGGPPPPVTVHRSHFAGLGGILTSVGLGGCDVILADLGVSSMQVDDPARGFSYKSDGPLDMRMDDRLVHTAADLLATLSTEQLAAALRDLADEPDHARIAAAIVRQRTHAPITTTGQLAHLVLDSQRDPRARQGRRSPRSAERHPAARTFQALRMLVNDEAGGLEQFLRTAPYCLNPGGRLAIITFHSGEHRRVEQAFEIGARDGLYDSVSTEPLRPTPAEVHGNPRSRSALLHWARRARR